MITISFPCTVNCSLLCWRPRVDPTEAEPLLPFVAQLGPWARECDCCLQEPGGPKGYLSCNRLIFEESLPVFTPYWSRGKEDEHTWPYLGFVQLVLKKPEKVEREPAPSLRLSPTDWQDIKKAFTHEAKCVNIFLRKKKILIIHGTMCTYSLGTFPSSSLTSL